MPLIVDTEAQSGYPGRLTWRERLRSGRVVPIISDEALFDLVLGGHQSFLASYARYVNYPFGDEDKLVSLVKYHKHRSREAPLNDQTLKFDFLNYVKNYCYRLAKASGVNQDALDEAASQVDTLTVSEFAHYLGYPRFEAAYWDDPLLILADLPFKTVLTTSPYTFIEDALRRAGKNPRTELCRWRRDLDNIAPAIDSTYWPSTGEPLVFHLLGLDRYVDSLVLTEDDFLEFLGNINRGQGDAYTDRVPALVRKALFDDLLLLGFNTDSWSFRVIYNGLIKPGGRQEDRGVFVAELPESEDERRLLEDYVQREAKFQIYWGGVDPFLKDELRTVIDGSPRMEEVPDASESQPQREDPTEKKAIPLQPRVWLYMTEGRDPQQLDLLESADHVTWGANEHTRAGDLVVMYRTTPKADITALFRALSNPQPAPAGSTEVFRRDFVVDLADKIALTRPVTLPEIRAHPRLADWNLARSPQGAMREATDIRARGYWEALRGLLVAWNPACAEPLARWEGLSAQELLAEALTMAGEIPDEAERGKALVVLAASLTGELLDKALVQILAIGGEPARAQGLLALAPHLAAEQLDPALTATAALADEAARGQIIAALAPRLSQSQIDHALSLARAIEDEASRQPAIQAIGQAQAVLHVDFGELIAEKTRDFTGREWALAEIDRWLADPSGSRFFVITGEPGSGKTALAAQLTRVRDLAAAYFCLAERPDTADPRTFIRTVLLQLFDSLPEFGPTLLRGDGPVIKVDQKIDRLASGGSVVGVEIGTLDLAGPLPQVQITQSIDIMEDGSSVRSMRVNNVLLPDAPPMDTFDRFVVEPLTRLASSSTWPTVILIDSLDEALTWPGGASILDLVVGATGLPPQVRFIVTTRPDPRMLEQLEPQRYTQLALDPQRPENLADLRVYVERRVASSEALQKRMTAASWQVETFIAGIVRASDGKFGQASTLLITAERGEPLPILDLEPPTALLEGLLVLRIASSADRRTLSFVLDSPSRDLGYRNQPVGSVTLAADPASAMESIYERLAPLARRPMSRMTEQESLDAQRRVREIGLSLYREMFPPELKRQFRRIRELRSQGANLQFLVISDEPWIPWEWAIPYEDAPNGVVVEDDFLCAQFEMSRWLADARAPQAELTVQHMTFVHASSNLPAVKQEIDYFADVSRQRHQVSLAGPLTTLAEVVSNLSEGKCSLFHFAGPGDFDAEDPNESRLVLADEPLRPTQLTGSLRTGLHKSRPMVFLNATSSGRSGAGLTGLAGWAVQFISSGAPAFVGSLSEPNDALAAKFAMEFYNRLWGLENFAPQPIARAFREARLAVREIDPANPTWLTYVLYAYPNTTVVLGPAAPAWYSHLSSSTRQALRYAEAIRQAAGQSDPAISPQQVLAGLFLVRGEETEALLDATLEDPAAQLGELVGVKDLAALTPAAGDVQPAQLGESVIAALVVADGISQRKGTDHIRARHVLGGLLAAPDNPAAAWLSQATRTPAAALARVVDRLPEREALTATWIRNALQQETDVLYDIQLDLPAGPVRVGEAFTVVVKRLPAGLGKEGQFRSLTIPRLAATGGNLGLVLDPSGLQVTGSPITSLPLDPEAEEPPAARFTVRATRPGAVRIVVELHVEPAWQEVLEGQVMAAGVVEAAPAAIVRARPVPQPDLRLQVVTRWTPDLSHVTYQYRLDSFRAGLPLGDEIGYSSDPLPTGWLDRARRLLALTLEGSAGATGQDASLRLASIGYHLGRAALPADLQRVLRQAGGAGRTLLIVCDQDAWLPWGLLHDGSGFLAERFTLGLWPRELDDTRPFEFPLGRLTLASFEPEGVAAPWVDLLQPPALAEYRTEVLEGGMFDLRQAEVARGLHLLVAVARGEMELPVLATPGAHARPSEAIGRKLTLRRNRPLVSLSYLSQDRPEPAPLAEAWGRAYIGAGCSAFVGPLWSVIPAVEAAFVSTFYAALWGGANLGEALQAGRRLARLSAPESLDWLAYTLLGDPMARPYLPVKGDGYAVVEPVGREMEDVLLPDRPARFRVMLQRKPPVWNDDRIVEVAETFSFQQLQARIVAPDLTVTPGTAVDLFRTPEGDYLGWFTLSAAPGLDLEETLVQVFFVDGKRLVHSLMFPLKLRENGVQP